MLRGTVNVNFWFSKVPSCSSLSSQAARKDRAPRGGPCSFLTHSAAASTWDFSAAAFILLPAHIVITTVNVPRAISVQRVFKVFMASPYGFQIGFGSVLRHPTQ